MEAEPISAFVSSLVVANCSQSRCALATGTMIQSTSAAERHFGDRGFDDRTAGHRLLVVGNVLPAAPTRAAWATTPYDHGPSPARREGVSAFCRPARARAAFWDRIRHTSPCNVGRKHRNVGRKHRDVLAVLFSATRSFAAAHSRLPVPFCPIQLGFGPAACNQLAAWPPFCRRPFLHPSSRRFVSPRISLIGRIVAASTRHPLIVLLAAVVLTTAAVVYLGGHFNMTADTARLISPKLEWRHREIVFEKAFPQLQNLAMIVVDGATPELADDAAKRLAAALQERPDLFHNVRRPDGGPFFERNGLMLLSTDDVESATASLMRVQPILSALANDPSLRGVLKMLSFILLRVLRGEAKLQDIEPQMTALASTFEKVAAGQPAFYSWRTLVVGTAPELHDTRRMLLVQPVMNYAELQPGQRASEAIRVAARSLGLGPAHGVVVRLTGPGPLAGEDVGRERAG